MTPEEAKKKYSDAIDKASNEADPIYEADMFVIDGRRDIFYRLQGDLITNWQKVRKEFEDGDLTEAEYKVKRFTECSGMYAQRLIDLGVAIGTFTDEESTAYMDANWLLEEASDIVMDNDTIQYDACFTAFMEMRKWYIDFHTEFFTQ